MRVGDEREVTGEKTSARDGGRGGMRKRREGGESVRERKQEEKREKEKRGAEKRGRWREEREKRKV